MRGTSPQTGEEIDHWGCAVAWMPILQTENAKEVRQAAAATESFRNEMVGSFEAIRPGLYGKAQDALKRIGIIKQHGS